ncbi:hypothetical protein C0W39_19755 [Photobacterium kishitanii]|nr:hypothetical protein C0W39_19755 [Photobacterium kishitanii]
MTSKNSLNFFNGMFSMEMKKTVRDIKKIAECIRDNNTSLDARCVSVINACKHFNFNEEECLELVSFIDDDINRIWPNIKHRNQLLNIFPSLMTEKKFLRTTEKKIDAISSGEQLPEALERLINIVEPTGVELIKAPKDVGFYLIDIDATFLNMVQKPVAEHRGLLAFSLINLSFDISLSSNLMNREYNRIHSDLVSHSKFDVLNYAGTKLNVTRERVQANYWLTNNKISKSNRLEIAKLITEYSDAYVA